MSRSTVEDCYRGVLIGLTAGDCMALHLAGRLHNFGGFKPAE